METFDDSSDLGAWTNQNADTSRICTSFDPTDIATGLPKTGAALTLSQSFNPNGYPTCKKFDTGSSDTTTSADNTNKGQFDTDAYTLKMTYDLNENQTRMQALPSSNLIPLIPSKHYFLEHLVLDKKRNILECCGPKGTLYIHSGNTLHRNFPIINTYRFVWSQGYTLDKSFFASEFMSSIHI